MTLLGKTDGASGADGTSYLDLVAYIRANGAEPKQDLIELWKRIVFNMAVSNTDDHLRNHGFILAPTGWRLSPLFDVNPIPSGDRLSLNVSENDNSIDLALAMFDAFEPRSVLCQLCLLLAFFLKHKIEGRHDLEFRFFVLFNQIRHEKPPGTFYMVAII